MYTLYRLGVLRPKFLEKKYSKPAKKSFRSFVSEVYNLKIISLKTFL